MKKMLFPAAFIAAFVITSCGGGSDVSVSNVCDCMKLKDKYESIEDALKDLGEEKFKEIDTKCKEYREAASDEDLEKCK